MVLESTKQPKRTIYPESTKGREVTHFAREYQKIRGLLPQGKKSVIYILRLGKHPGVTQEKLGILLTRRDPPGSLTKQAEPRMSEMAFYVPANGVQIA